MQAITLMTNNPAKYRGLAGHGDRICGREPLETTPNSDNIRYLTAKQRRLDHALTAREVSARQSLNPKTNRWLSRRGYLSRSSDTRGKAFLNCRRRA